MAQIHESDVRNRASSDASEAHNDDGHANHRVAADGSVRV